MELQKNPWVNDNSKKTRGGMGGTILYRKIPGNKYRKNTRIRKICISRKINDLKKDHQHMLRHYYISGGGE